MITKQQNSASEIRILICWVALVANCLKSCSRFEPSWKAESLCNISEVVSGSDGKSWPPKIFWEISRFMGFFPENLEDKSQFRHANYQNRRSLKNSKTHHTTTFFLPPPLLPSKNAPGSFLEVGILWKRDITNQRQRQRPQRKTKAQRKHEHGGANPGGVLRHVFFLSLPCDFVEEITIYILGPTTTLGKYCDKFWVFWVLSFATAVSCLSRVWTNNIMYISHSQWISSNHLWPNLSTENSANLQKNMKNITIACGYMTQLGMVFSQLTSITLDLDRSTVVQWVGWETMVDTIFFVVLLIFVASENHVLYYQIEIRALKS